MFEGITSFYYHYNVYYYVFLHLCLITNTYHEFNPGSRVCVCARVLNPWVLLRWRHREDIAATASIEGRCG